MLALTFSNFTKKDWILWIGSIFVLVTTNIIVKQTDIKITIASLIGVTSLIFAAKRNVWSQILIIVFSLLYGLISYEYRYWGEMITYLGMTLPMAFWAMISWLKHPDAGEQNKVQINKLKKEQIYFVTIVAIGVTLLFYFVLVKINTPNIIFSTASILTSFVAATLTMLRSPFFAFWYAMNDLVLIVLWVLACRQDINYAGVVINFVVFFINDMYGFLSWKKEG